MFGGFGDNAELMMLPANRLRVIQAGGLAAFGTYYGFLRRPSLGYLLQTSTQVESPSY